MLVATLFWKYSARLRRASNPSAVSGLTSMCTVSTGTTAIRTFFPSTPFTLSFQIFIIGIPVRVKGNMGILIFT